MSRLAVIPARGGSKRIPRKNLRPLAGVPLVVHTIRAAIDAGLFERVVVSTDDDAIAEVARAHGAEPYVRAAELADDHTPASTVTLDVLTRLDPDGARFEHVAQLLPSCPLRTAEDVRAGHEAFAGQTSSAQISVTRFGGLNPWWALRQGALGRLEPLFEDAWRQRSQDLPALFCPSGALWWATAEALRRHGTFHLPERTACELPWRRAIDIDDEDDWELAELLMRGRAPHP